MPRWQRFTQHPGGRRPVRWCHALVAAAALAAGGCSSPAATRPVCPTDWDDARLLLDCFGVDELPLVAATTPSGAPIAPASYVWTAPAAADLVVCAVFVD